MATLNLATLPNRTVRVCADLLVKYLTVADKWTGGGVAERYFCGSMPMDSVNRVSMACSLGVCVSLIAAAAGLYSSALISHTSMAVAAAGATAGILYAGAFGAHYFSSQVSPATKWLERARQARRHENGR